MRLKLFSTLVFSISIIALHAQFDINSAVKTVEQEAPAATQAVTNAVSGSKPTVGNLLSQFAGQISTSAFTNSATKDNVINAAKSATSAKSVSGVLQSLASGLKSTAFNAGWAKIKQKWLGNAKTATTVKQVAGSLQLLSQNINPKYLGSTWPKIQPTFSEILGQMAQ